MGIISIIAGGYVLMYPIATAILLPKIFILVLGIWGLMYGIPARFPGWRLGGRDRGCSRDHLWPGIDHQLLLF